MPTAWIHSHNQLTRIEEALSISVSTYAMHGHVFKSTPAVDHQQPPLTVFED